MSNMPKKNRLTPVQSKQPWFVLCSQNKYSVKVSHVPFISHFYSFEASHSINTASAIPDGCLDIIFDCDSTHPTVITCGTTLEPQDVSFIPKHHYFGVRLSPSSTPNFLNTSASSLINKRPSLIDISNKTNELFEKIIYETDFLKRTDIMSNFLIQHDVRQRSRLTEAVLYYILEKKGNIQISTLEYLTDYSSRTIQRQFIEDTGLTPKFFCRIIRCQRAIYNITDEIKISALADKLGFNDQAHFSRDFNSFTNTSPKRYIESLMESSYLEKIEVL